MKIDSWVAEQVYKEEIRKAKEETINEVIGITEDEEYIQYNGHLYKKISKGEEE